MEQLMLLAAQRAAAAAQETQQHQLTKRPPQPQVTAGQSSLQARPTSRPEPAGLLEIVQEIMNITRQLSSLTSDAAQQSLFQKQLTLLETLNTGLSGLREMLSSAAASQALAPANHQRPLPDPPTADEKESESEEAEDQAPTVRAQAMDFVALQQPHQSSLQSAQQQAQLPPSAAQQPPTAQATAAQPLLQILLTMLAQAPPPVQSGTFQVPAPAATTLQPTTGAAAAAAAAAAATAAAAAATAAAVPPPIGTHVQPSRPTLALQGPSNQSQAAAATTASGQTNQLATLLLQALAANTTNGSSSSLNAAAAASANVLLSGLVAGGVDQQPAAIPSAHGGSVCSMPAQPVVARAQAGADSCQIPQQRVQQQQQRQQQQTQLQQQQPNQASTRQSQSRPPRQAVEQQSGQAAAAAAAAMPQSELLPFPTSSMKASRDRSKYANYPMDEVTNPGQNDVLLGRGSGASNHLGNIRYRMLITQYRPRYAAASRVDKPKVADLIVHMWRNLSPPGRFLTRCDNEEIDEDDEYTAGRWMDVGDAKAKTKTCQCLREKDRPKTKIQL